MTGIVVGEKVKPKDEVVLIEFYEDNLVLWEVYKIVRNYSKPIFAGMTGVLVTEELALQDVKIVCEVMKVKRKKMLEVFELLPYFHGVLVSGRVAKANKVETKGEDDGDT